jgi:hypothetical protein
VWENFWKFSIWLCLGISAFAFNESGILIQPGLEGGTCGRLILYLEGSNVQLDSQVILQ